MPDIFGSVSDRLNTSFQPYVEPPALEQLGGSFLHSLAPLDIYPSPGPPTSTIGKIMRGVGTMGGELSYWLLPNALPLKGVKYAGALRGALGGLTASIAHPSTTAETIVPYMAGGGLGGAMLGLPTYPQRIIGQAAAGYAVPAVLGYSQPSALTQAGIQGGIQSLLELATKGRAGIAPTTEASSQEVTKPTIPPISLDDQTAALRAIEQVNKPTPLNVADSGIFDQNIEPESDLMSMAKKTIRGTPIPLPPEPVEADSALARQQNQSRLNDNAMLLNALARVEENKPLTPIGKLRSLASPPIEQVSPTEPGVVNPPTAPSILQSYKVPGGFGELGEAPIPLQQPLVSPDRAVIPQLSRELSPATPHEMERLNELVDSAKIDTVKPPVLGLGRLLEIPRQSEAEAPIAGVEPISKINPRDIQTIGPSPSGVLTRWYGPYDDGAARKIRAGLERNGSKVTIITAPDAKGIGYTEHWVVETTGQPQENAEGAVPPTPVPPLPPSDEPPLPPKPPILPPELQENISAPTSDKSSRPLADPEDKVRDVIVNYLSESEKHDLRSLADANKDNVKFYMEMLRGFMLGWKAIKMGIIPHEIIDNFTKIASNQYIPRPFRTLADELSYHLNFRPEPLEVFYNTSSDKSALENAFSSESAVKNVSPPPLRVGSHFKLQNGDIYEIKEFLPNAIGRQDVIIESIKDGMLTGKTKRVSLDNFVPHAEFLESGPINDKYATPQSLAQLMEQYRRSEGISQEDLPPGYIGLAQQKENIPTRWGALQGVADWLRYVTSSRQANVQPETTQAPRNLNRNPIGRVLSEVPQVYKQEIQQEPLGNEQAIGSYAIKPTDTNWSIDKGFPEPAQMPIDLTGREATAFYHYGTPPRPDVSELAQQKGLQELLQKIRNFITDESGGVTPQELKRALDNVASAPTDELRQRAWEYYIQLRNKLQTTTPGVGYESSGISKTGITPSPQMSTPPLTGGETGSLLSLMANRLFPGTMLGAGGGSAPRFPDLRSPESGPNAAIDPELMGTIGASRRNPQGVIPTTAHPYGQPTADDVLAEISDPARKDEQDLIEAGLPIVRRSQMEYPTTLITPISRAMYRMRNSILDKLSTLVGIDRTAKESVRAAIEGLRARSVGYASLYSGIIDEANKVSPEMGEEVVKWFNQVGTLSPEAKEFTIGFLAKSGAMGQEIAKIHEGWQADGLLFDDQLMLSEDTWYRNAAWYYHRIFDKYFNRKGGPILGMEDRAAFATSPFKTRHPDDWWLKEVGLRSEDGNIIKKYTDAELDNMTTAEKSEALWDILIQNGLITNLPQVLDRTARLQSFNLAITKFFDWVSDESNGLITRVKAGEQLPGEGWTESSTALGGRSSKLGPLNSTLDATHPQGHYTFIKNELVPFLKDYVKDPVTGMDRLYGQFVQMWKIIHAPLNFPAGVTGANYLSNVFAHSTLAGFPAWLPSNIPSWIQSQVEFWSAAYGAEPSNLYSIALKHGTFGLSSHLKADIDAVTARAITSPEQIIPVLNSVWDKMYDLLRNAKYSKSALEFYGHIDDSARYYLFKKALEMWPGDYDKAAAFARRGAVDYSSVPTIIRSISRGKYGIFNPFISYPYLLAGLVAEAATSRPWVLAPVPLAVMAFNSYFGTDTDRYLANKPQDILGQSVNLPQDLMADKYGNPVYAPIGRIYPPAELLSGDPQFLYKTIGGVSFPLLEVFLNKDSWSGQQIYPPGLQSTMGEKTIMIGNHFVTDYIPYVKQAEQLINLKRGIASGYPPQEQMGLGLLTKAFGQSLRPGGAQTIFSKTREIDDAIKAFAQMQHGAISDAMKGRITKESAYSRIFDLAKRRGQLAVDKGKLMQYYQPSARAFQEIQQRMDESGEEQELEPTPSE